MRETMPFACINPDLEVGWDFVFCHDFSSLLCREARDSPLISIHQ